MTETIGILIIFFIIVVFGLIFYSNFQKSSLLKQKEQILERDAISLSLRITYLQELRCEQTGGLEEETGTCIDLYKIQAITELIDSSQDNEYYTNLFGTADIYFKDMVNNITYNIYNSTLEDFTKRTRVRTPILLRNVTRLDSTNTITTTRDYFGVLYVDAYN